MPLPPIEGEWVLVFSDEFIGTSLDKSKWHTCFWWATDTCTIESNNELELYSSGDVFVQDGFLRLQAQKRNMVGWNGKTYQYTSGMVMGGGRKYEKPPGFTFTYGYAEARVKIPKGKGLWPAFWMLPLSYKSRPEIDISEILGDTPNIQRMHYHYLNADGSKVDQGNNWIGPDFSQDWHTFGVHWASSEIVWYVDGVERWRFSDSSTISSEPMYVLLNLAVGGNWPGSPDAFTSFPSYYDVDYVRVWQKSSNPVLPIPTPTPTPTFPSSPTLKSRGDLNDDGKIDLFDISRLLTKWGSTKLEDLLEADINAGPNNISQGVIDIFDANRLMANWTK